MVVAQLVEQSNQTQRLTVQSQNWQKKFYQLYISIEKTQIKKKRPLVKKEMFRPAPTLYCGGGKAQKISPRVERTTRTTFVLALWVRISCKFSAPGLDNNKKVGLKNIPPYLLCVLVLCHQQTLVRSRVNLSKGYIPTPLCNSGIVVGP